MPRRVQLEHLLKDLRSQARISTNPQHNVQQRDAHVTLLQRIQDWLWSDYDWPFLRVERQVSLQAGQRYMAAPESIPVDRIEALEVFDGGEWVPLKNGVGARQYAWHNSDLDVRAWPPRCWRVTEGNDADLEQIELWPIPDRNGDAATREGFLKITGIRRLSPLVQDTDRADLESRLLVLFGAAELLAAAGAKDAQPKQQAANAYYGRIRSQMSQSGSFQMFGVGGRQEPRHRDYIDAYRPPRITGP